jgi:hypothetical protein
MTVRTVARAETGTPGPGHRDRDRDTGTGTGTGRDYTRRDEVPNAQRPGHRGLVWVGVLFVVLGGVLGIHGLGTHRLPPTTAGHGVYQCSQRGEMSDNVAGAGATATAETHHATTVSVPAVSVPVAVASADHASVLQTGEG